MSRRPLPKYCSQFRDRHGKVRVRFRRKGQASHYFRHTPWTPEFMREYQACLEGIVAPTAQPGTSNLKPGSFNSLITVYYNSPDFRGLRPSTQKTYRGILERFREKHGEKSVASIERKHIKAIIGAMHETPSAANNLLDRLRGLMTLAVDLGVRKDDPTIRMRGYANKSDGFHTWTEEEITLFEARHNIGTKPYLALALMLYTGQRRSDAVNMGWCHVVKDRIQLQQQKTGASLEIPIHPILKEVIALTSPESSTFLVTSFGKPFTPAGFGNWFREQCNEAGLKHCSAHGLRKAAARRLAEAGCSNQEIKSITGHKTDREVSRYTAAADQTRLASQAMAMTYGTDSEQQLSNSDEKLDNSPPNTLKYNGEK